ncbi:MAG: hypothetical protein MJZ03_00390 [archaeon]|nr:hypothetical protein [archaeon]
MIWYIAYINRDHKVSAPAENAETTTQSCIFVSKTCENKKLTGFSESRSRKPRNCVGYEIENVNKSDILYTTVESTVSEPITEVVTEECITESAIQITVPETEAAVEAVVEEIIEEYIVYKPSTHYLHKNSCRWNKDDAVIIIDTSDIEARRCSECNPDIEIMNEYIEPKPEAPSSDGLTYIKHFSRGTYYCYGYETYGGSGRYLYDCSYGNGNGIKGSIASSYLYYNYGYNYNGERTKVYLEVNGYPEMSGWYFVDDSDAGNSNVIDFYYIYASNCPFRNQGVVEVDAYI